MENFKNYLGQIIMHCMQKHNIELTPSDLGNKNLSLDEVDYISELFDDL
jgi:hypothetical protein